MTKAKVGVVLTAMAATVMAVPVTPLAAVAAPSVTAPSVAASAPFGLSRLAFATSAPGDADASDPGDVWHEGTYSNEVALVSTSPPSSPVVGSAGGGVSQVSTAVPGRLTSRGSTSAQASGPASARGANRVLVSFRPDVTERWRLEVQLERSGACSLTGVVNVGPESPTKPARGAPALFVDEQVTCATGPLDLVTYVDLVAGRRYYYEIGHGSRLLAEGGDRSTASSGLEWQLRLTRAPLPSLRSIRDPRARGVARVGRRLEATRGTWRGSPTAFGFGWLRDGKPIRGADGAAYRLTRQDAGHRIAVRVVALRHGDRAAARSRTRRVL